MRGINDLEALHANQDSGERRSSVRKCLKISG